MKTTCGKVDSEQWNTYIWILFDWDVDFFWKNDWSTNAIGKNQRFIFLAIYLKQIASDFTNFWNNEDKSCKCLQVFVFHG